MALLKNIKELVRTLDGAKDLLAEMFEKRNSFSYKYDMAVELTGDSGRVDRLIDCEILIKNGAYIEFNELYLDFFEQVLEVNEQISTAFIQETVQQIKEYIDFYLKETKEDKQYTYLKQIKSALQKIARVINRSIIDLNRNIDNTFKTESNYKIKLQKLHNFDDKRKQIKDLIEQTEQLITGEELTFFSSALDVELLHIVNHLRLHLNEDRHNISETHNQIIEYINQTKHNTQLLEKVKQVKYLKDMHELGSKTNFKAVIEASNALLLMPRQQFSTQLSLGFLQTDEGSDAIVKARKKLKINNKVSLQLSDAIADNYLQTEEENEYFVNIEELKRGFMASGNHLFDFVMHYNYDRKMEFHERVTLFCRMASIYETEFALGDSYLVHEGVEFAVIYPKK